jgi:hypothetical protein
LRFSACHLADWLDRSTGRLREFFSRWSTLPSVLRWGQRSGSSRENGRAVTAFLPAIVFALIHNFVLNSAIGFPFDWDLMCVVSPPLLYAAVFLIARSGIGDPPGPSHPDQESVPGVNGATPGEQRQPNPSRISVRLGFSVADSLLFLIPGSLRPPIRGQCEPRARITA